MELIRRNFSPGATQYFPNGKLFVCIQNELMNWSHHIFLQIDASSPYLQPRIHWRGTCSAGSQGRVRANLFFIIRLFKLHPTKTLSNLDFGPIKPFYSSVSTLYNCLATLWYPCLTLTLSYREDPKLEERRFVKMQSLLEFFLHLKYSFANI